MKELRIKDPLFKICIGALGVASCYGMIRVPYLRELLVKLGLLTPDPLLDGLDATLRKVAHSLRLKNILYIDDLTTSQIYCIMELSSFFKSQVLLKRNIKLLDGRVMATYFCEASTRTRCSFESAMMRLGGDVLSISDITSTSALKGESMEDSIKILSSYCDLIILRHSDNDILHRIKPHLSVPLINAGAGSSEHPTQSLLDIFTIYNYFPYLFTPNNTRELTVTFVGDLKYSRTVHSLVKLLSRFNVVLRYIAPSLLQMPPEAQREVEQNFAKYKIPDLPYPRQTSSTNLTDGFENADIIYVTRIQKERMNEDEYKMTKNSYHINKNVISKLMPHTKILHPLPRVDELSPEIDNDERCVYFEQAENGLYVRMALLYLILNM